MDQNKVSIEAVDVGDLFKDLVWTAIKDLILSRLALMVPILMWGPIGIFTSFLVGIILSWVYDAVKMAIDLQVIKFTNEKHQAAYDRASIALKLIARDKGINSPEFKEARDVHKKELAVFVKFNV